MKLGKGQNVSSLLCMCLQLTDDYFKGFTPTFKSGGVLGEVVITSKVQKVQILQRWYQNMCNL